MRHAQPSWRDAAQTHLPNETLAGSLLSAAIDDADPDADAIAKILAGIPGLSRRLDRAETEAAGGIAVELRDL